MATADTVLFANYFEADYEALFTQGDYYQFAVYDPINLASNLLAVYA